MTDVKPATSPADQVGDLPKIREAMAQGVREALRRHKQARNPVATWRDGAVVWVPPEDIPVDAEAPPEKKQATGSETTGTSQDAPRQDGRNDRYLAGRWPGL